jgi:hypothetical protein
MAEKRMTCWRCPRYDREARRCRDGKTNPKSKADSIAVAEQLGLRALCHYNPYRDPLARRMHFPERPVPLPKAARRVRRLPIMWQETAPDEG